MGNLHDTLKGQTTLNGNDKDLQDMMKSKASDVFHELDDPEYFKTPVNTILGQLYSCNLSLLILSFLHFLGSLSEIKIVADKYRRYTYFPLMDRTMFCKIMPLSKRNSSYLFEILSKQGNRKNSHNIPSLHP